MKAIFLSLFLAIGTLHTQGEMTPKVLDNKEAYLEKAVTQLTKKLPTLDTKSLLCTGFAYQYRTQTKGIADATLVSAQNLQIPLESTNEQVRIDFVDTSSRIETPLAEGMEITFTVYSIEFSKNLKSESIKASKGTLSYIPKGKVNGKTNWDTHYNFHGL